MAEHVLPLLMPLLIAQQLNVQQFAKYMAFVKDILRYYNLRSAANTHPPPPMSMYTLERGILELADAKNIEETTGSLCFLVLFSCFMISRIPTAKLLGFSLAFA